MDNDSRNNDFFQVSVKGLFFKDRKLMMIQEDNGTWELPGGRIQKGEDMIKELKREVLEETGLECQVLDSRPAFVYSAVNSLDEGRVMVFYKINLDNLNFKSTNECIGIDFFTKEEIKQLKTTTQLKNLPEYL